MTVALVLEVTVMVRSFTELGTEGSTLINLVEVTTTLLLYIAYNTVSW